MPATATTPGSGRPESIQKRWEADEKAPLRIIKKPEGRPKR